MRRIRARYSGKCRQCGGHLEAGEMIRWSRASGAVHASEVDCESVADMYAEQAAEMRAEAWMEARFAGTTSTFFEDQDYARA